VGRHVTGPGLDCDLPSVRRNVAGLVKGACSFAMMRFNLRVQQATLPGRDASRNRRAVGVPAPEGEDAAVARVDRDVLRKPASELLRRRGSRCEDACGRRGKCRYDDESTWQWWS
jgi:hypothetical protein